MPLSEMVHTTLSPSAERTMHAVHALCNAHLLRELTFIEEYEGHAWPVKMKALILQMKGKRDLYIEQGRGKFPRTVTDAFLEEFDAVTANFTT